MTTSLITKAQMNKIMAQFFIYKKVLLESKNCTVIKFSELRDLIHLFRSPYICYLGIILN
jgi:hypothetical protein